MKIPFSWLKEFVPLRVSATTVAAKLTHAGFEVESLERIDGEDVFEINVTPNRGDALSVLGIAREVSALFGVKLSLTLPSPSRGEGHKKSGVLVSIKSKKECPFYAVLEIGGVKVGPSPDWLAKRLSLVGIRSINNIVDVTNYVLMEMGQPLHAFDRKKIHGNQIIVRKSCGEKLLTLDGLERSLTADDLVIADQDRILALAGVMGGKDSEIDDSTESIVLESAFFNPVSLRKTSRRLGIQTDSSYRFSRGVDPAGVMKALQRAADLIQKVAGGCAVSPLKKVGLLSLGPRKMNFSPSSVWRLLGGDWSDADVKKSLRSLSFGIREMKKDRWEISIPTYRSDISTGVSGESDLIEEVARFVGLQDIPETFPPLFQPSKPSPQAANDVLEAEKEMRGKTLLVDLGFSEAIHLSFSSIEEIQKAISIPRENCVFLENPLSPDYSLMRPSLLPSLLKTLVSHHRHRIFDVRFFELRTCFRREASPQKAIVESKMLSGVVSGRSLLSSWDDGSLQKKREVDFYELKGILEKLGHELGAPFSFHAPDETLALSSSLSVFHPGKKAEIRCGAESVGVMGDLHPEILKSFELDGPVSCFEIHWDKVMKGFGETAARKKGYQHYSPFPSVERDLALVLDESVPASALVDLIQSLDSHVQEVSVFDVYRGAQVPEGKKSLALSVTLGRMESTMTDEVVNDIMHRFVVELKKSFGAEVR